MSNRVKATVKCAQALLTCVCASVSGDVTALPRGTPLYGQPSWWGDGDADDENSFKQETKSSTKKHDGSISGRRFSDFEPLITQIISSSLYLKHAVQKMINTVV